MSATYTQQDSCPPCPLRAAGCYAEVGTLAFTTRRLNRAPTVDRPVVLAKTEARQIDALTGWRKLRVHVVGDSRTPAAARVVGAAMVRYSRKHEQPAWTYTHAWRTVARADWRGATVLASCDRPADVPKAQSKGYPIALVVPEHPSRQVYQYAGLSVLPCPAQFKTDGVRGAHCETCQICERPDELTRRGLVLGFQPDTYTRAAMRAHLAASA